MINGYSTVFRMCLKSTGTSYNVPMVIWKASIARGLNNVPKKSPSRLIE